ncbi:very short patch repair endonuclease [Burkholderia multivorans]|nr:very short patch repair endonuclease [Burkholderia multivorans]ABX15969.1 DNA mismatch endonuclease Vsr [Burkholderia multivorans ATCC 17616]PRF60220.1 very short patch repair endonuclease [Burkholderia multivorans]
MTANPEIYRKEVAQSSRKLTKSEQMARVRSRNTAPELALRRALWHQGLRYRLTPKLPGTPDLCFVTKRVAIFVDGCFWHGCPQHYSAPAQNAEFWSHKVASNITRDRKADAALEAEGWTVMRVWEHELKSHLADVVARIEALLDAKN